MEKKNIFNQVVDTITEEDIKVKLLSNEISIRLEEDDDEDDDKEGGSKQKKAHICLVKAGWNANDYYFSEENLDEILQLMTSRPKLYLDHDYFGMGRSEKDWVASYTSFSKDKQSLIGDIVFTGNPLTVWLYDEIKRNPKEVQFSIDIRASVTDMDTPDGRTGRKVEKVLAYRSTDIVSYAAAGGEAIKILNQKLESGLQSIQDTLNNKQHKEKKMDITLAKLKAENPEVYAALIAELTTPKVEDLQNSIKTLNTEADVLKAKITELEKDKSTAEAQITTLTNSVSTIEAERDALKLKVDEVETAQKVAAWKTDIANAIAEAKLDEKLVTPIFLSVLEKETDIAKVKEMIEDRKGIVEGKFAIENGGPAGEKPVVPAGTLSEADIINGIKS